MKVNNSNISAPGANGASGAAETAKTGATGRSGGVQQNGATSKDDVHLSELVKNLRSLAAESPERQNKIEALARSYANGSYKVDAAATASGLIDDASAH